MHCWIFSVLLYTYNIEEKAACTSPGQADPHFETADLSNFWLQVEAE